MSHFETLQIAGLQPSLLANKLKLSSESLSRLFAGIQVTEYGCWQWVGDKQVRGYGRIKIRAVRSSHLLVHRLCYQLVHGPIPDGIQIHHKVESGCRGTDCCNPLHMEETTPRRHVLELSPTSPSSIAAHRDCCAAGHPYTIASTRIEKRGGRTCKICAAEKAKEFRRRASGGVRGKPGPRELKSHCIRGHAMEGDNVAIVTNALGEHRKCKACAVVRQAEYDRRKKS